MLFKPLFPEVLTITEYLAVEILCLNVTSESESPLTQSYLHQE